MIFYGDLRYDHTIFEAEGKFSMALVYFALMFLMYLFNKGTKLKFPELHNNYDTT